ncbi:MAG: DUF3570 domain-containing protein [Gammaproteobacteria bacterium]|nr:DUF3570 domain-containing protein [Gammaproteobacteria bacterium]
MTSRPKQRHSIRKKLTIASCTLLSHGATDAIASEAEDWAIDASFLHYTEQDRVTVDKIISSLVTNINESNKVKVDLVFDTMSGSTPSGAVQGAGSFVTVTTPSGAGGFSAGSGSTAIAEFEDTRLAVALDWEQTKKRLHRINYGSSISVEKDYTSFGLNSNYAQDVSNRIMTYSAGVAVAFDEVRRSTGGTPEPFTVYGAGNTLANGNRVSFDTIFGATRILNRRTIGQLNFSSGFSDGYLTDPYKLISRTQLVDPADPSLGVDEINTYYEKRPSSRQRSSVYTSMAHTTRHDNVLHLSYRYYWDDWGIDSNTLDFRLKLRYDDGFFVEPHVRIYNQTAANFYYYAIEQENYGLSSFPQYASADYRLDKIDSSTIGISIGKNFPGQGKLRVRIEKINWQYANSYFDVNNALVLQVSYKKLFE